MHYTQSAVGFYILVLLMSVSLLQAVPGAGEGKEEPGLTREELQVTYDTLR